MISETYKLWRECATLDADLIPELIAIENDEEAINDAFYKDLEFGTAGLRGIIGAGTNRLNVYTVGKATQGLAAYVNSITHNGSVAIAYDSRNKSDKFARETAGVFAANGIKVYIYSELMPTPMLSYAVRKLKCDAGVVITASHNPAKYNGYKAYDSTGCQLGPEAADYVLKIMNGVDIFNGVKRMDFEEGIKSGIIEYIDKDVIDSYLNEVLKSRVSANLDMSDLNVIYTPLHGTGNKPVREILKRIGVTDIHIVPQQELPDGNFPTAPYPNPEIRQPFEIALKMAETVKPDLLLATDPDCDRVGIAINTGAEYELLSGNDVGVLLLNYILSRRSELGTLPENPVAVKTIVSTEICKKIAADYGCELVEVLTGFKFIGEQVTQLENKGQSYRYVMGFEESYGYLIGDHARDKDAVVASMLICEMTAYYKSLGKNLKQVLEDIYEKYGYYLCLQKSFTCEGQAGTQKIKDAMERLRNNPPRSIADTDVVTAKDFLNRLCIEPATGKTDDTGLPKSNVLGFYLSDGSSVIVRPSGTEPKIKLYISAVGKCRKCSEERLAELQKAGEKLLAL